MSRKLGSHLESTKRPAKMIPGEPVKSDRLSPQAAQAWDRIVVRTPLQGHPSKSTELPVSIVEMIIDAYGNKPQSVVGGKVDTVTITDTGVTWNSRKDNCPDNQD